jgi:hypothetical protein
MDPRAREFTTEAGIKLWVLPLQIGEVSPLDARHTRDTEPGVLIIYADGPRQGQEQITFGLSSLESYVENLNPGGLRGSVDYVWTDLCALLDIALARLNLPLAPAGPRARLSGLAERLR